MAITSRSVRLAAVLLWLSSAGWLAEARRGPHHPVGEVRRTSKIIKQHLVHDNEHMAEEIESSPLAALDRKPTSEMSEEEKAFYYFKLHDLDNNDKLDGLELMQAAMHHHSADGHSATGSHSDHYGNADGETVHSVEDNGIEHIINVIDNFLVAADDDYDGLLNYVEYTSTLQADARSQVEAAVQPV